MDGPQHWDIAQHTAVGRNMIFLQGRWWGDESLQKYKLLYEGRWHMAKPGACVTSAERGAGSIQGEAAVGCKGISPLYGEQWENADLYPFNLFP